MILQENIDLSIYLLNEELFHGGRSGLYIIDLFNWDITFSFSCVY